MSAVAPPSRPRSASSLALALALALPAASAGCTGEKPTEEQCRAFTEHFNTLLEAGTKDGKRGRKLPLTQEERVLELCVKEGTAKEVACALEQDSFEAIAENCK